MKSRSYVSAIVIICLFALMESCDDPQVRTANEKEPAAKQRYLAYNNFREMIGSDKDSVFPTATRITSGGSKDNPTYHGFFFYNCSPKDLLQFDPTGRYMVGMQVSIEGRAVLPTDTAVIGIIDLYHNNEWKPIGFTTAWNWQQGCRLEWIPGSADEIIWDARAADGKSFVSQIYNTSTKKTRTLPRPVYTVAPDGKTALTHDFERMEHGGTNFVGIPDKYKSEWAPAGTGIFKMDLKTGKAVQIVSVRDMAKLMFPEKLPADTANGRLYIFREGYNVSGSRFLAFVKDVRIKAPGDTTVRTVGYSMDGNGKDIRFFYEEPSHHYWSDDSTVTDNIRAPGQNGKRGERAYFVYTDNGSGVATDTLWKAPNGHDSYLPGNEWILTDTYSTDGDYPLNGYQYLYLYHIATKKFILLGKYPFKIHGQFSAKDPEIFRVDLHPRISPDGRKIAIDATRDGLGRQIYLVDIGFIIDNPPLSANN